MYVVKIKDTGRIVYGLFNPIETEKEAQKIADLGMHYWTTLPGKELGVSPELIVEQITD